MTIRKRLLIAFMVGLLLMGLGTGVAFAEFSTFQYGGEKNVMPEMVSKNLSIKIDETKDNIYFYSYWGYKDISIVSDISVPNDEIAIDIKCSPYITPAIRINNDFENDDYLTEYNAYEGVYKSTQVTENDIVYNIYYDYYNDYNGMSEVVQAKNEVLESLKNRKVYSYNSDNIESITIRVSPEIGRAHV